MFVLNPGPRKSKGGVVDAENIPAEETEKNGIIASVKINHHCISHNSCLELRNAHFANSERINFLNKRKRIPARKNYALGVSGLEN